MVKLNTRRMSVWVGCNYRDILRREFQSVLKVLEKLDMESEVVGEELCCGFPFYLAGCFEKAKDIGREVLDSLKGRGTLVTACPACLRGFREAYPKMGLRPSFEALHITELLDRVLSERGYEFKPLQASVMYHDPCELGRHMGVYEEPRRILSRIPGVRLVEPRFSRERSVCCGGGGLLTMFAPFLPPQVAVRKLLQEDEVAGRVDILVTACPQCVSNLRSGVEGWAGGELRGLRVLDFCQLLEEVL